MPNADTRAARTYHEQTKHSPESVRAGTHRLDFTNQPRPFKLYTPEPESLPLPRDFISSVVPALSAIAAPEVPRDELHPLDLATLTTVLHYSAGITKHLRYSGGRMAFRAASCTGALYHIELYVVCGDLPDLPAGVYQYAVHDHSLKRLREGDYRGALVEASAGELAVVSAPATIVCTSTFWRNSWKYQERAYRHVYWDSGVILANLLAVASAHRLPARVVAGFVDREVNRLLAVDGETEAAVCLVPLGYQSPPAPSAPSVPELHLDTVPLSANEIDYPAIRQMHLASELETREEVLAWRAGAELLTLAEPAPETAATVPGTPAPSTAPHVPMHRESTIDLPLDPTERVIQRRGSSRHFEPEPIDLDTLATILLHTTGELPADFRARPDQPLNDPYLIACAVDGLPSGTYRYQQPPPVLDPLRQGEARQTAAYLALGQGLAGQAAVNVYFLADLEPILDRLGNRGYRAATLDAAITAGRMYLAAYALGLGATGLTFFDDEVVRVFSPQAAGHAVTFLIAFGIPGRRS
jgi:SagB-type dehydrogenase family enzyme